MGYDIVGDVLIFIVILLLVVVKIKNRKDDKMDENR
jgi:hypothetical protein